MKTLPYNKADFTVPFYDTFPQFVAGIAKTYGPKPALSWFTRRREEKRLTYTQLTDKVTALRRCLLKKKLPQGTHIAIISENSADAETIPALSSVSRPYFDDIMVVNAATGELTAMTTEVVTTESIFNNSITPMTASGSRIRRIAIAIYASLSLSTLRSSECIS